MAIAHSLVVMSQGMCLVVSVTTGSPLLQAFGKKKDAVLFPLGPLSNADRKDIVQQALDMFGKKLSDSAFNNQVLLQNMNFMCFAVRSSTHAYTST